MLIKDRVRYANLEICFESVTGSCIFAVTYVEQYKTTNFFTNNQAISQNYPYKNHVICNGDDD